MEPSSSVREYRCPSTHAVDGQRVRCIFPPHESDLAHKVRLSGSGRVVRWGDDDGYLRRLSLKWMTTFDKPWEYLTPRLALDMRTGGKR